MHAILVCFSLILVTKSLPDPLLIFGIKSSPILVDSFPVVFTEWSSVICDVFLVLCTIDALAAGESFLFNFMYLLLRRVLRTK